jgi:excinuclease ABC subunit C
MTLSEKIEGLPTLPGVYLMKDKGQRIIYVGKAVNLRNRVRSYFNAGTSDTRAFVQLLGRILFDIETVVVKTEKEALLLENELIKKHRPRFNVQLRDDKNFLCLRLDASQTYPRLETVRRPKRDGARYFGPYASANSIRETLRVVNRFFQLRTCSDHVLANRKRPCLLHQIGRCPAPCAKPVDAAEYKSNVEAVTLFLQGRSEVLKTELKARMRARATALEFEEAARLRDQVIAIERSLEKQTIANIDHVDQDVFGFFREADRIVIYIVYVRGGRISGGHAHHFSSEFPDEELLLSFVNQYYADENFVPKEVLLSLPVPDTDALEELLKDMKEERVAVRVPQRGEKTELIKLANSNAERAFIERRRTREEVEVVLARLQERLALSRLPRKMECFDISHFQGASVVASQVVSIDTVSEPSLYRHYTLKTVTRNDDFAAMYEVLQRRLKRGVEEGDLPDLIVIDGGKGQLGSVVAAMRDLGVNSVDVVSLAKSRDLEQSDNPAERKTSDERVFLVSRKDPVVLPQTSPELFALTRLRDEAHRFAIAFQRKTSRKQNLTSQLDAVPGVGPVRRKALLKHFGSVKALREAGIEALAEVDGIGPKAAETIWSFLNVATKAAETDSIRDASLEDANAVMPADGDASTK